MASAQLPNADPEAQKAYHSDDSIPRQYFLNASDLKGLSPAPPRKKMQAWYEAKDNSRGLAVVQDIRLRFDNKAKALAFLDEHLTYNSEGMAELTNYHLDTTGCSHLHIYKDDRYTRMLGLKLNQYCILFTNGRYFVKLFLTCHEDFKYEQLQPYIFSIVKKLEIQ